MHYVVTYHYVNEPEAEKQASALWFDTPESAEEYVSYLETKPSKRGTRVYTVKPTPHPAIGDVRVIEDELAVSRMANLVAAGDYATLTPTGEAPETCQHLRRTLRDSHQCLDCGSIAGAAEVWHHPGCRSLHFVDFCTCGAL